MSLSFNMVGDGLRDDLDPRLRGTLWIKAVRKSRPGWENKDKEVKKVSIRKNKKYIITELKGAPEQTLDVAASYEKWAKRVLWLSDKVVPGAYNFMFSWYLKPNPKPLEAHTHDYPEVIIFLGSNPDKPQDLGGEIEFWMEDEKYNITKSCFIWVPKGMKHCPMVVKRVDRPIIHLGSSVKPGYKV